MPDKQPVGVVGLGLMGTAASHRLLAAGHPVLGLDVDAARSANLQQMGGRIAGSLADIARAADVIVLCVFNTEQTEDVVERGFIPALPAGSNKIVLATSTLDPDRLAALAQRSAVHGIRVVDAPVSGSSEQVRLGEGVGLVGGDLKAAEDAAEILDVLFPVRFHMGASGNGGRAKLAVNLIAGLNRLVVAEGLVFAERMGLEPKTFLEVAKRAASYSQAMETKGRKMVEADFAPLGRARQTLKDVHLMLDQGRKLGQGLPLAALSADVLEACVRQGEGELDNSVIINEIRRRTLP